MAGPINTDYRTKEGTALGATAQSPLDAAMDDQHMQIMKLREMLSNLVERLQPVVRQYPQKDGDAQKDGEPSPVRSQAVEKISRNSEAVKSLQGKVSQLLEDLDV